jgi:alkyldihydroxyacetonephosphate synthase
MPMKWWGWGEEDHTFSLPDPERFWGLVADRLGELGVSPRIESLDAITLPPSRIEGVALAALRGAIGDGDGALATDTAQRAVYSLGKGYRDAVRIRRGEVPHPTDAVIRPQTEEQVAAVLVEAARHGIAVIPFGGGTSVVGGVEPTGERPTVTLDLQHLARVLTVDPMSATATIEAGILGPALEAQLNARGFTLGHFPQSFQFSSLGGWIATRSGGQKSTLYGKIEERVQSLRLSFPGGVIATRDVPAAAAGPDLNQLITGSEGILGVITQATMRLSPSPQCIELRGILFPTFPAGVEAAREMMQHELTPSVLRLSDETETAINLVFRSTPRGLAAAIEKAGGWYLNRRGVSLDRASVLILGFEGEEDAVSSQWRRAKPILRRWGGVSVGRSPGRAWERSRYEAPYLRDVLLDRAILVDTLETATTWDRYLTLYATVRDAIAGALGERSLVMAHLSHSYPHGGSIYFTFIAPQEQGREIEQWERAKKAATQAIIDNGAALSHHHGIGSDHRPWMAAYLGPGGARALSALKQAFDPQDIMNPGKLTPMNEGTPRV